MRDGDMYLINKWIDRFENDLAVLVGCGREIITDQYTQYDLIEMIQLLKTLKDIKG